MLSRYGPTVRAPKDVPGAKTRHGGAPYNMRRLIQRSPPRPEADLEQLLAHPPPEVKPWVLGALTPYQREGWRFAHSRAGSNLWWACVAGDAEIVVNRAGKAIRMRLDDFVRKFNGGKTRGQRWHKNIQTFTRCMDEEGTIIRGRVQAAFKRRSKQVFEVVALGSDGAEHRVKATADHQFSTPTGYQELQNLIVGSQVHVVGKRTKKPRGKQVEGTRPYYRVVSSMHNHPYATRWLRERKDRPGPSRCATVPLHRMVYEAYANGLSLEDWCAVVRSGEGIDPRTDKPWFYVNPTTHDVHHRDHDPGNNDISNLEYLTCKAHHQEHAERNWRNVLPQAVAATITSITALGVEPVYDIAMAGPHHNFVANEFVVHNCGAGKTWIGILWALSSTFQGKVVVVTKANTKYQWKREWEKLTTLHPTVLEGQGGESIDRSARVLILNWDILPHWVPAIRTWQGGTHLSVVYDEIHRGKNWQRKEKYVNDKGQSRWRSANNQASAAADLSVRAYRRLGLTATPVRNRLSDLWAQLDLIEPGCWGSNWEWAHRYCDAKPGEYGGLNTNGKSNMTELNLRLKEVCHIVKFEEMARELPPKRRQLCYLSHAEQSRPSAFSRDMKEAAKRGRQALFEMKLLEAASRKRAWIVDVVSDAVANKQKVVVFTGRRQDCERLGEAIGAACDKLQAPCWWAHGGHSGKAREEMAHAYASYDGACAFVGTTDAFGEAIDGLQHTDLAIFGLLPWTPGQLVQAEGRFSRKGQTRPVLIMYTVAEGTVDEHVADLLLEKLEGINDEMISEAGAVASTLAQEDREDEIVSALLAKLEEE